MSFTAQLIGWISKTADFKLLLHFSRYYRHPWTSKMTNKLNVWLHKSVVPGVYYCNHLTPPSPPPLLSLSLCVCAFLLNIFSDCVQLSCCASLRSSVRLRVCVHIESLNSRKTPCRINISLLCTLTVAALCG